MTRPTILLLLSGWLNLGMAVMMSQAAPPNANYDESKVPNYTLPDPLKMENGQPVESAEQWPARRREILDLFTKQVYGRAPEVPKTITVSLLSKDDNALGGKAIRKEYEITLAEKPHPVTMALLLCVPKSDKPAPAFLGLNFRGNHTITNDSGVRLNPNWMPANAPGVVDHKATEESRGNRTNRWPVEMIVDRGYALGTIYYGDIDPDFDDGFKNGIHAAEPQHPNEPRAADAGGSIAAWAWGLSRALDALEQEPLIDAAHVAVIGHSRLGKTSLWAGATDPRFALVISNDSGCGGAALSRREFGETVARINTSFPHWFCDNFQQFNNNVNALPVDQHELIALMAPRPVYVASAAGDQWADPKGEFLSTLHADPVFRLLGTDGLGGAEPPQNPPPVDHPIKSGMIGYHVRTGKHDLTDYDWQQYLDFADRHFKSR